MNLRTGLYLLVLVVMFNSVALFFLYRKLNEQEQFIKQIQNREQVAETIVVNKTGDVAAMQQKLKALADQNQRTQKKVEVLEEIKTGLSQPKSVQNVSTSERKLVLMRLRVNKFYRKNQRYPQTIAELKQALVDVPVEDVSNSKRIALVRDFKGGWFYNQRTGSFAINVR